MSSDGVGPAEQAVSSSSDINTEGVLRNVALNTGGKEAPVQEAATSASKSTVQSSAQASAAETTSTTTNTGVSTSGKADHLLVLVHGLVGTPQDFGYFQKCIQEERLYSNPKVLVHATRVNTGKTYDGVGAGGVRVAEDIKQILKRPENSDIGKLSIVGFSLGGLYARYAVALLYDPATKTVAGLEPNVMMTVASPHLGVRSFGWFRFLPPFLQSIAQFLFGLTGMQMMLLDKGFSGKRPLLFEMSRDSHLPFKSALAAFKKRLLYANVQNDFMVPYGTATLQPHLQHLTLQKEYLPPQNATILEDKHLDGCRIWYEQDSHTHAIPALEFHSRLAPTLSPTSSLFDSENGISGVTIAESDRTHNVVSVVEGIPESVKKLGECVTDDDDLHRRPLPVDRLLSVLLERSPDFNTEKILTEQQAIDAAARNGNGNSVTTSKTNLSRVDSINYPITPMSLEEKMAGSLRELSWKTVCVDFPLLVPIAHNRIVAMGRHPLEEWMNAPGRRAVQHMVDEILGTSKTNV
eukprot:CAMPEP_0184692702 /NCGR_PEP_ID=MMETSP0313-20130426/1065_1 /TAXON_ID=2792 /ORGANISM="Porphyridium aerugineum, Strain SAG 1380-2" /LENGTH=521 /DNA_ID=CAMNT_0027150551 /DNA_START=550 /DNA_END=2115 /DNA_ORIENTATION=+